MRSWSALLTCLFALSSCQPAIDPSAFQPRYAPGHQPQADGGGYVTLPGQAPVQSGSSITNDAFDAAVQNRPADHYQPTTSTNYQPAPPIANYKPVEPAPQPSYTQHASKMDYTVKIHNNTGSRLFIEAQDAKGMIYPCGFTQPKQAFQKSFRSTRPIASPILVVIRDPDQSGAPELRRYRVAAPNVDYNGRTVKISILSGGRYTADVDGQVYVSNSAND